MGGGGGRCAMHTVEHVCCVVFNMVSPLQSLIWGRMRGTNSNMRAVQADSNNKGVALPTCATW